MYIDKSPLHVQSVKYKNFDFNRMSYLKLEIENLLIISWKRGF